MAARPGVRTRRPLLLLLIAGFVTGVVWLTRDAWRPSRRRGAPAPVGPVPSAQGAPRLTVSRPATAHVTPPTGDRVAAEADAATPAPPGPDATAPRDDLTRLEGIGPRMAAALTAEGLGTFDTLAASTAESLRLALAHQGLRFAPTLTTWPAQARLLADGDEAGFAALVSGLRRGGSAG